MKDKSIETTDRNLVKKTIAIILPNMAGGGVERVRLLLAEEFKRRGYNVEFVILQDFGELRAEIPLSMKVTSLRVSRMRKSLHPLVAYLSEGNVSAVMAAMWPLTGITVIAAKIAGFKGHILLSEHVNFSSSPTMAGMNSFIQRRFGKWVYGAASSVVAVSRGVAESLEDRIGAQRGLATIIMNPVRKPGKIGPLSNFVENWWDRFTYKVIAIGSLTPPKDYPNLLRSFASLRELRNAGLVILGEGPLRGELEALIVSLGLQDIVLMPGFVPNPYPYLSRADLFVLSSAWEGLGNVIIEALVAGVPVVSTDCPSGPAEILENGRYGRLVPVGDPEALAVAMAEALDTRHDRAMLRRRGNEFSVERAADQYLALLDPGGKMLASK